MGKSTISAFIWRGSEKFSTRNSGLAEAGRVSRNRPGAEGGRMFVCAHVCVSGCGCGCAGAHPCASSCLRWGLEKKGKKYVQTQTVHRKTLRNEVRNGQIIQCHISCNRVCKILSISNKYWRRNVKKRKTCFDKGFLKMSSSRV